VLKEQKVDMLGTSFEDRIDPQLFEIFTRVKDPGDVDYVRDEILKTCERFRSELIPQEKLDQTRSRIRYGTTLGWSSSAAIASFLAPYVSLRRTPETIEKLFAVYESITPEDIRTMVSRYITEQNRTIVTLATKPNSTKETK
jgi:zinc protease